jgi:dihydroorotase
VDALQKALLDGTVDCIATDHAPHHLDDKDGAFALASAGISGLETAVAVIMDQLVHTGKMNLEQMVSLFTLGPAQVLGVNKGQLGVGQDADITIIDPNLVKVVDPLKFFSKGKNTPFKGWRLRGWPIITIVNGQIVFEEGKINEVH